MSTIIYKSSGFGSDILRLKVLEQLYNLVTPQKQEYERSKVFGGPTSDRFVIHDDEIKEMKKTDDLLMAITANMEERLNTFISFQHDEGILSSYEAHAGKPSLLYVPIEHTTKVKDVISEIKIFRSNAIARRLTFLHEIIEKEQEEKSIVPSSLQNFARFIISESQLPNPDIGINPNGLLQAVWEIPDYGTLAMNFLTSGDIMFAVVFSQQDPTSPQRKISGVLPSHKIMYHIKEFVDKLIM